MICHVRFTSPDLDFFPKDRPISCPTLCMHMQEQKWRSQMRFLVLPLQCQALMRLQLKWLDRVTKLAKCRLRRTRFAKLQPHHRTHRCREGSNQLSCSPPSLWIRSLPVECPCQSHLKVASQRHPQSLRRESRKPRVHWHARRRRKLRSLQRASTTQALRRRLHRRAMHQHQLRLRLRTYGRARLLRRHQMCLQTHALLQPPHACRCHLQQSLQRLLSQKLHSLQRLRRQHLQSLRRQRQQSKKRHLNLESPPSRSLCAWCWTVRRRQMAWTLWQWRKLSERRWSLLFQIWPAQKAAQELMSCRRRW